MTISTTTTRVAYTGDGISTAFAVPFPFFAADELEVIERDAGAGTETLRVLGIHYVVAGGDGAAGTVTATTAPSAAVQWVIRRRTARVQETDYTPNDPFPAETHEKALDRLTMIGQELGEESDRALRFPKTDATILDPTLPGSMERAGKVLAFDDTGAPAVSALTLAELESGATNAAVSAAAAATSASAAAASEADALASKTAAGASEANAAASAAAAAAMLAAGMFSGVQDKSANYAAVEADAGDLLRVDAGAGGVTVTLPPIASLAAPEGFKIAVMKWAGAASATVVRSSTDTINGATNYVVANQYETAVFVADAETRSWAAVDQSPPLADHSVANAKLAQMPANSLKGNNTGAMADAADLTAAQATAMLNALVGDSGAGGTKGLVPAPAVGDAAAGKFLKADGTWTAVTSTLSGKFTSAEQTISAAGQLTLAHGLGVAPILMFAHLVCKTAEANYSVGDKVATSFGADSDANPNGMGAVFDATNITIRFASTGPFALPNKTTGNYVALTPANWKLVITAFA